MHICTASIKKTRINTYSGIYVERERQRYRDKGRETERYIHTYICLHTYKTYIYTYIYIHAYT